MSKSKKKLSSLTVTFHSTLICGAMRKVQDPPNDRGKEDLNVDIEYNMIRHGGQEVSGPLDRVVVFWRRRKIKGNANLQRAECDLERTEVSEIEDAPHRIQERDQKWIQLQRRETRTRMLATNTMAPLRRETDSVLRLKCELSSRRKERDGNATANSRALIEVGGKKSQWNGKSDLIEIFVKLIIERRGGKASPAIHGGESIPPLRTSARTLSAR
ncbi:hypothetical protein FB451DRAFT_1187347 [Mycena latifolia]|nr:hypothetical protein FB451DRAFT_1187347 [Mycena latifolia]